MSSSLPTWRVKWQEHTLSSALGYPHRVLGNYYEKDLRLGGTVRPLVQDEVNGQPCAFDDRLADHRPHGLLHVGAASCCVFGARRKKALATKSHKADHKRDGACCKGVRKGQAATFLHRVFGM